MASRFGIGTIPFDARHSSLREFRGPCVDTRFTGAASTAIESVGLFVGLSPSTVKNENVSLSNSELIKDWIKKRTVTLHLDRSNVALPSVHLQSFASLGQTCHAFDCYVVHV